MKPSMVFILAIVGLFGLDVSAHAQKAPEAGYVYPPGGKAGTTVEVRLGGFDWTPDMEYFTLDPRVKLVPSGLPGPIMIPPPPYWFGAKGRIVTMPLPREVPAKLTIPADMPPGPIYWQAANANGCTSARVFMVGTDAEVLEEENAKAPQLLPNLPVTVSGRLWKNEEVDRYRFVPAKDGLVTCDLLARRLGAKFLAIVEVRTPDGQLIAEGSGTSGSDPAVTFPAKAGVEYTIHLHDVDFGGDRSYGYRLNVRQGPRVLGTIPAAGRHGETREVEVVGIGVATGGDKIESVKRQVTFPATGNHFDYRLETPLGSAAPFRILLSDLPENVISAPRALTLPAAVTGVLDEADVEDDYFCAGKKGDVWLLSAQARAIGSALDVALTIFGPDGKEVARNDDLPETTDAGLEFTLPKDGTYRIVVSDMADKAGSRAAIYRLVVRQPAADFTLQLPTNRVSVPLGGKFDVPVKAIRKAGFHGPITLKVTGLPAGVTAPANLVIAAGKTDLPVTLQAAADASCAAGLVTIEGTAALTTLVNGKELPGPTVTRTAQAPNIVNLAPRSPDENHLGTLLVASVFKPRFKGQPVDQDTGRKVHRGSTFPADVIIERLEGFQGEIILQMASQQSYQLQGSTGGEVKVPPGATKAIYPCYMPEWMETIRTSRIGMVAVAQLPDPRGKVRWLVNDLTGFITMTMEGALLKVSTDDQEFKFPAGRPFEVRVRVSRLTKLNEPVRLELKVPDELTNLLKADPVTVPVGTDTAVFKITPAATIRGMQTFSIRGTALQDGKYPAISETAVAVEFTASAQAAIEKR